MKSGWLTFRDAHLAAGHLLEVARRSFPGASHSSENKGSGHEHGRVPSASRRLVPAFLLPRFAVIRSSVQTVNDGEAFKVCHHREIDGMLAMGQAPLQGRSLTGTGSAVPEMQVFRKDPPMAIIAEYLLGTSPEHPGQKSEDYAAKVVQKAVWCDSSRLFITWYLATLWGL